MNFDYSPIKYEAPIEYQVLGASLSKRGKVKAVFGSTHVTARKLGAFFANPLPEVRALEQAYKNHVTEIAEMPTVNPKGKVSDNIFADLKGADRTTISAAAISGKGVVTV